MVADIKENRIRLVEFEKYANSVNNRKAPQVFQLAMELMRIKTRIKGVLFE